MSQSSETTKSPPKFLLGYPGESWTNDYYTARVAPGLGVTVAKMLGCWMVQFFPLTEGALDHPHTQYVSFITQKARKIIKENGEQLFNRWPFLQTEDENVMILKCIIEDGVRQIGEQHVEHQRGEADAAAGASVE